MAITASLSFIQQSLILTPLRSIAITVLLIPFLYFIVNEFIRASSRIPGFKGPRGLPLIGNIAQIRKNAAEQYRIWSKTYGPVYQIQLGNIPVIVVNSAVSAKAIFGQNAQALSSRPEFYTFHKVELTRYPFLTKYTIDRFGYRSCPTLLAQPSGLLPTVTR